jgi:hypothetical protein
LEQARRRIRFLAEDPWAVFQPPDQPPPHHQVRLPRARIEDLDAPLPYPLVHVFPLLSRGAQGRAAMGRGRGARAVPPRTLSFHARELPSSGFLRLLNIFVAGTKSRRVRPWR